MKLSRITKPLPSVQVRVTLSGELHAALENYASYYAHIHGDSVEGRALIPEMLRAFIEADREFQSWSHARPMAASTGLLLRLRLQPPRGHSRDCRLAGFADALGEAPRAFQMWTRHSFANEARLQHPSRSEGS